MISGYSKEFLEEMRKITDVFNRLEAPAEHQPYGDVERIIKLREITKLTQEQVAKILGMTKEGWGKKERTCKRWIASGRPAQEKYENDYRLTAAQIRAVTLIAKAQPEAGKDVHELCDEWDTMLYLLEDATLVDPFLTETLLRCVAGGTPTTLQLVSQTVTSFSEPTIADSFTPSKYVRTLRGVLVTEIQRRVIDQFPRDEEFLSMVDREIEYATVELKRKAHQQEFEEILKQSCTQKDLYDDRSLYRAVKDLARNKPLPKDSEDELRSTAARFLAERVMKQLSEALRRMLISYFRSVIVDVEYSRKWEDMCKEIPESNLFDRSTKSQPT